MAPYLQTVTSFTEVPITDAGVDTLKFLEAAEGLVGIFTLLNSTTLGFVQTDLKGNIEKVRTRYNAHPDKSATLEELVLNEKGEKKRTATEGLLWLLRGLSFTCKALQRTQVNKAEELSTAFGESYAVTLKQYHNFVMKGVFAAALKGCPYRAVLYTKLAEDPNGVSALSQDTLSEQLDKWLAALDAIIARLQKFYADGGHDKGF